MRKRGLSSGWVDLMTPMGLAEIVRFLTHLVGPLLFLLLAVQVVDGQDRSSTFDMDLSMA